MIIFPTINKSDNLLLNDLSQVISMKFNMLHFTMCNRIISNLDYTLIAIVKNNRGFDREPELTQGLLDPYSLNANINNTMPFFFSSL